MVGQRIDCGKVAGKRYNVCSQQVTKVTAGESCAVRNVVRTRANLVLAGTLSLRCRRGVEENTFSTVALSQ